MSAKKTFSRICSVLCVIIFILSVTQLQAVHAAGVLYAKTTASGAGNCQSWDNACALQTALADATAGNEIWAAAGTYKPTTGADRSATFHLKSGVALYGGFAGTETSRNQRDPATNLTILSGDLNGDDASFTNNGENVYHVVTGSTGATLDGFTITAGNANGDYPNSGGGGMYNSSSSPMLTNVTFNANTATEGGGMYNINSSSPTLTNVTFSSNTVSSLGGGTHNEDNSSPKLTNVTFSSNVAGNNGGGMSNYSSSNPILTNVTFSGNMANQGGGMYNRESSINPTIRNTIFWGNTAGSTGAQIANDGSSTPSVSYSVVQGGYAGGTYIISTDPKLGALGNYGGSTQTIPLLAGSSAIDAGDNATCPATDQRGYVRPVDGDGNGSAICDIGAYEAGSVPTIYVYLPLVQKSGPRVTPTPTGTPGTITPTATKTTARTATPTTPAIIVPRDGIWKFSSGWPYIERNMSAFLVQSGSIINFRVYIFPVTDPCSFEYFHDQTVLITGGSFSFTDYEERLVVSGSFTSSTTALGNIHIIVDNSFPLGCNLSYYEYNGPWQAYWWGS